MKAQTIPDEPENTGSKQNPTQFQPGQSGNPKGRPKGSRNRVTMLAEALVDDAAEEVISTVIQFAKQGDPASCRLLMDRILPARKERPTPFTLPPIGSVHDLPTAFAAITAAVAEGEITLSEAAEASRLIENYAKAVEMTDLAARIEALEARRDK
jgi:hypothetical protein